MKGKTLRKQKAQSNQTEPSPYKSKEFQRLQEKWYKLLEKDGFQDIEESKHGTDYLRSWHSNYFQVRYDVTTFESNREYFELACKFLYSFQFESDLDRSIWELHSEGETIRNIARTLKKSTTTVNKIIITLRKIMIKDGTTDQTLN